MTTCSAQWGDLSLFFRMALSGMHYPAVYLWLASPNQANTSAGKQSQPFSFFCQLGYKTLPHMVINIMRMRHWYNNGVRHGDLGHLLVQKAYLCLLALLMPNPRCTTYIIHRLLLTCQLDDWAGWTPSSSWWVTLATWSLSDALSLSRPVAYQELFFKWRVSHSTDGMALLRDPRGLHHDSPIGACH